MPRPTDPAVVFLRLHLADRDAAVRLVAGDWPADLRVVVDQRVGSVAQDLQFPSDHRVVFAGFLPPEDLAGIFD